MEREKITISLNMSEYISKIEEMPYDMLKKEYEKIKDRLKVTYTVLGKGYYIDKEINIANNPDELNRIFVRKEVSAISKIISGQLLEFSKNNFDIYWKHINDTFMSTTNHPQYADADIGQKNIPFANRLNVNGLLAYKRYLLALSDSIKHNTHLLVAITEASNEELYYDEEKLDRSDFYTNYFLPQNTEVALKNVAKLRIVREQMKKVGNYQKTDKESLVK